MFFRKGRKLLCRFLDSPIQMFWTGAFLIREPFWFGVGA